MSEIPPARPRTVAAARRPVEGRRLVVVLVVLALAASALVLPREAAATTAHRPRIAQSTAMYNYAKAMLGLLNQERHSHGLRPLQMNWRLRLSAHRHNLHMAKANTMSHQLPNEPFFATRISNAGYKWRAAGENIGWNSLTSKAGLLSLERAMYHEVPPNDGHRVNILSRTFRQVGIDAYVDRKHHKIWFTQDFGTPAS
jgi:uncharacterized protein YkwD